MRYVAPRPQIPNIVIPPSIRHSRNNPTSFPVPAVIPAKAGIWTRGTAASLSRCALLRRLPRGAGAEEGGACGDEQAASKEEQQQQAA